MYYRIKINDQDGGNITYFTDALNFADAGFKIIKKLGTEPEIEEIKLMKNFKPAMNEQYSSLNKIYIVKIAEDMMINGKVKTIKYELPVFANDSNELHDIISDYISQGFETMRLTTISETKWIWI